jgi:hypothetical protein
VRKLLIILFVFCTGVSNANILPTSFAYPSADNKHTNHYLCDSLPYYINQNGFKLIPRDTKLRGVVYVIIPEDDAALTPVKKSDTAIGLTAKRKPLIKMSGNILYDVNYRSKIDTPYAANNVYQHTAQTRIDILYKDKYPLKLYITSRFGNTSLFRNYSDFNLRFNPSDFKRIAKEQMMIAARQWIAKYAQNVDSVAGLIEAKKTAIALLRLSLQKPDIRQQTVEEREKTFYNPKKQYGINDIKDTALDAANHFLSNAFSDKGLADSLKNKMSSIADKYGDYKDSLDKKKQRLDSLERELQQLVARYKKIKSLREENLSALENEKDPAKLADILYQLRLPDTILPKGYKMLSGIESLGIGRAVADYSELSVKNISITGVQAAYNTKYYYAVAAGRVDYRFRDYIVPNHTKSNQWLALVRFGRCTKNGNHIFLTYYTGKRQFYNASAVTAQDSTAIPGYRLAGITIEGVYKINKNISLSAEIAKSTLPYYSLDSTAQKQWMNAITKLSSRSNEAYSGQINAFFPKTFTRFNGYIAYLGADFQSFSTFTTGAAQTKWMAKLEQPFFKNRFTVISSVQKNNYSNPFVATSYKSASLLTSVQANLHIKKYPVVSLGYFPAYQLTKTGNEDYSESRYYTLTGSIGHTYKLGALQLSSYGVYSRFYNEAVDSGFVYYNSKNLLLSQNIHINRYSILLNGSLSTSAEYTLRMLEGACQVYINKILSVGAGLKMNDYSLLTGILWGYSGTLTLNIPKIGDIQLMTDKGFIPSINKQLADNKTARLIFYKTF